MFYNKNPATGITKFVNYSNASPRRAEKFSRYLKHLSKTNSDYMVTNYLDRDNVERSIKVIERKWKPRGSRSFKQGILAYGVPVGEYPVEKIMKFNRELLQKTFPDFPWMVAVHTNKRFLHSHFLLVTTNVLTGKKLSQSPRDLQAFKDQYDELALKYGFPVLKRHNPVLPVSSLVSTTSNSFNSEYTGELEIVTSAPVNYFEDSMINSNDYFLINNGLQFNTNYRNSQKLINAILTPISAQIQRNSLQWYEMGKNRRCL